MNDSIIHFYTDQPASSQSFLPVGQKWIALPKLSGERESVISPELLRLFFGDRPLWGCQAPTTMRHAKSDRHLLIVDYAETSQFALMTDGLKQGIKMPDGLVCLALQGDRHRGQRQRAWMALRGNLHLTAHYRMDCPVRSVEGVISMVPAVAAALAIDALTPPAARPAIKWVNDVLMDGQKVSGGLTGTHVQGDTIESALFGIGVNVAAAPDLEAGTALLPAGSLAPYGVDLAYTTHTLIRQITCQVQRLLTGNTQNVYQEYRRYAGFIGRIVQIWPETEGSMMATQPSCEGRVLDVLPDLSLRLDSCSDPVRSGRMTFVD